MRIVAIHVFEDVEPLDAVGPFEAFISAWDEAGNDFFDTGLVGETGDPVTAGGGLVMVPRWSFETLPAVDILLIPGGFGARALVDRQDITGWVRERHDEVELLLSVCTGSLVLAAAGLLAGLEATTHWNAVEALERLEPTAIVREGARWTDNGRIICSSGVSAGIDMALHVIARLHGTDAAARAARAMEYEYWSKTD